MGEGKHNHITADDIHRYFESDEEFDFPNCRVCADRLKRHISECPDCNAIFTVTKPEPPADTQDGIKDLAAWLEQQP